MGTFPNIQAGLCRILYMKAATEKAFSSCRMLTAMEKLSMWDMSLRSYHTIRNGAAIKHTSNMRLENFRGCRNKENLYRYRFNHCCNHKISTIFCINPLYAAAPVILIWHLTADFILNFSFFHNPVFQPCRSCRNHVTKLLSIRHSQPVRCLCQSCRNNGHGIYFRSVTAPG